MDKLARCRRCLEPATDSGLRMTFELFWRQDIQFPDYQGGMRASPGSSVAMSASRMSRRSPSRPGMSQASPFQTDLSPDVEQLSADVRASRD